MRLIQSPPVVFALGIALGLAMWMTSTLLLGSAEPWDAALPVWSISWIVIALLGGAIGRLSGALLPLGYALGQMAFIAPELHKSAFGALGLAIIGGYGAAAVSVTLVVFAAIAGFRKSLKPKV